MKSVMTMALMLLFTSGAWADPTVTIKKQLDGVDNDDAGTVVTSSISEGECTLTVTPPDGSYVTVDYITACSVWDGNMAQTPRRDPGLVDNPIEVTALDANADPSGVTKYKFTVPTDGSNVEVTVNFQSRKTLSVGMVADIADQTYMGAELKPALTIKDYGATLVEDKDYTVEYSNNVNVGTTAQATITGKGVYTGSVEKTFTISAASIAEAEVTVSGTYTYTGAAIEPTIDNISVTLNNENLIAGTDFEIQGYSNNVSAATYDSENAPTVTITGKGNYSGTVTQTFTIAAKDLASATVTVDPTQTYTYTGDVIEPNVSSVSIYLTEGAEAATTLTAGTDYTVTSYTNNTDAATATSENAPTVTITGQGNFTGTATGKFTIAQADLSDAEIADIDDQDYTGEAVTPEPQVSVVLIAGNDPTVLVKGQDFTYSYDGNVAVSSETNTPKVIVTGTGNYTGTAQKTFNIVASYDIWVAGTLVTSNNANNVLGGTEATVSYDEETNTLTLNGATINGKVRSYLSNLTIELIGNNTIAVNDTSAIATWYDAASLNFTTSATSPGSLTLTPGSSFHAIGDTGKNFQITYENGLSLNPATPDAGETAVVGVSYGLTVGGVPVTNANASDILADIEYLNGKVSFTVEDDKNLLILDGANLAEYDIVSDLTNLTIRFKGNCSLNTITSNKTNATLRFEKAEDAGDGTQLTGSLLGGSLWSGFGGGVTFGGSLAYLPNSDTWYIYNLPSPNISVENNAVSFSYNNITNVNDFNFFYTLQYEDENQQSVTTFTQYDPQNPLTINKASVLTVKARYKYAEDYSDVSIGKYFGAAENPLKLVYGGEAKALTLSPAIEPGDGIKISSVATGTNATYSSDTQKFTPVSTGTSNRTVTLAYTAEGGEYVEGNTVILNETFNLQVDVVPVAPTITPNGGSLAYNETITLSLPEGCDAAIEYKWGDGSVQEYTAPIEVQTGTLTAWAVRTEDPNNLYSDEVTATFKKLLNPNLSFTYTWTRLQIGNTFSQEVKSDMETTPTVTWSSSNEAIATVDPNTGVVTPVAAYNSDIEITATFAGDDTYAPATASYAVRVDKGEQYLFIQYKGESTTLAKARVTKGKTLNIKENYNLICPEELVASLTWTPDNATIATVADGVVSGVNCGNTRIVVASAGNDNYEEDTYEFYIDVAPPAPTIELETGTYLSTHAPITITKENIDGTSISYTWDDITGDNNAEWTAYTDAGVTLQTGTLSAMVGYYDAENYNTIYSDTASVAYTVIPDIAECTVSGNDNVTYNGADQTPIITVTPAGGGTALTLGTDYTVSYKKGETAVESMIDAGDYTIVITAKEGSAYGGTKEVDFTIDQANLGDVTIAPIADQTYTGSQITPTDITVTFNGNAVSEDEYTISYGTNINVGEGTVTLTSENKNFSTTSTKGATFTIVAKTLTADMVISVASVTYTGSAVEPELTIRDGDLDLEKGTDYTVIYSDNVSAGTNTAKATITGKGNYTGSADKMFTINKAQLTVTPDDKTYNVGDDIELTVSYDGFVDGDDEDVLTTEPTASYGTADVTKPGSYEITASGGVAQNYDFVYETGTLTINRVLDVSFASNTWATYCGTENLATPEGLQAYQVTAVDGSTVTSSAIDYIPANTAVLLKDVEGKAASANIVASAYEGETTTFPDNILQGGVAVDVSTITGGTVYVLYKDMFKRATGGTIPANRGYLVVAPSSGNAPELSITIGDDTTGIGTVGCDSVATDNDEWYTLDGQKLQQAPTQKGLYIKNGKKVVINKK